MKNIINSFFISFLLLTRIPLPFQRMVTYNDKTIPGSLRFFPMVGLLYGILLYTSLIYTTKFITNTDIISFILITIPYAVNKFFHFDGFCDVMDSFLADKKPEQRLEIMKDSSVGSFALGAALLFILLKFILFKIFISKQELWPYIILIPIYARYSMVIISTISKYARQEGTASLIVGKVTGEIFISSSCIFCIINFLFITAFNPSSRYILIIILMTILFLFTFIFKLISDKKIGGVTGDVLGALNEIMELIILCILITF